MSLLQSASNIVITGGSFVHNNGTTKDLKPLYKNVAPNAILNAGGRADPVRCHPRTREGVIARIEEWIMVTHSGNRRIFWLSGPAGAGKSAIMQTVAERCIDRNVPMANFFFFRADGTRNHSDSVASTLLFQLFKLFPALRADIAAIAAENPVIFRASMREQFMTLIETPLQSIRQSQEDEPLVVLIDGLDECSAGNGKEDQITLLYILHDIATRPISPAFIVLVASRTEAHLTTTFNDIGCHTDSIYLDESYRPSDDIRRFLTDEFSRIRRTHNLRDTLPPNWPPSSDLNAIVQKSSGQFVYAATATRFISNSGASPKRTLEIVLGLRPAARTSPFATLDSLYMYILSQAEDWSSVHDILAADEILRPGRSSWAVLAPSLISMLSPLGYAKDDILSSLSDLTALLRFCSGDRGLTIYHASLNDFLYDKRRAKDFHVDVNSVACRLAPEHFKRITSIMDLQNSFRILECVTEPDQQLTGFLQSFSPNIEWARRSMLPPDRQRHWRRILSKLYKSRDAELYQEMINRWQGWLGIE